MNYIQQTNITKIMFPIQFMLISNPQYSSYKLLFTVNTVAAGHLDTES